MGTRYSVVFQSPLPVDLVVLQEELLAAVDRVDGEMSPWKPASDLNRFNQTPPGEWVDLPDVTEGDPAAVTRRRLPSPAA